MNTSAVTCVVIRLSGEILMQLRDDGSGKQIKYPNMWCFPGGGIEKNENPIQAVIREMYEEFELTIRESECAHLITYTHDYQTDHVYVCRTNPNTKPIQREGADMKWMTFSEIKKMPLAWHQNKILYLVKNAIIHSEA
jgi:8-oxo-dGTP diphosphatase